MANSSGSLIKSNHYLCGVIVLGFYSKVYESQGSISDRIALEENTEKMKPKDVKRLFNDYPFYYLLTTRKLRLCKDVWIKRHLSSRLIANIDGMTGSKRRCGDE